MSQNTRKDPRAKVLTMTVRYRSATLGEFIEHHSYDVSRGGMFIKTPSPFPAGTLLKFEVKIAEDQKVMQGVGRVVWKRETTDSDPDKPCGMGVKFIKIDEESRAIIERLLQSRVPGSESAYEAGQAAHAGSSMPPPGPVFPPSSPSDMPAPEDRTVLKPAAELLQDALKQAGGAASSIPSSVPPAEDTHVETKRSSGRSDAPLPVDEAAAAAAWAHDALLSVPDREAAPPSSKPPEKPAEKVAEKPSENAPEKVEEPAPKAPSKAPSKAPVRAAPPSPPRREAAAVA